MSLNTLLEAAKYLEMQEQQQRHIRITTPRHNHETHHYRYVLTSPIVNGTSSCLLDELRKDMPPLVIDENAKSSNIREVHNKLEKHRRAHLKECFDTLRKQLPSISDGDKKVSNLSILHAALRCIETLKRRERQLEQEMKRLAHERLWSQQRLAMLKKGITDFQPMMVDRNHYEDEDITVVDDSSPAPDDSNSSTSSSTSSTASSQSSCSTNKSTTSTTESDSYIDPGGGGDGDCSGTDPNLSVLPIGQNVMLQKLIVPKTIDLPLVITQQQLNGKVVPLVNAQYVVKPVVVVSKSS